jgi:hypothetical protein
MDSPYSAPKAKIARCAGIHQEPPDAQVEGRGCGPTSSDSQSRVGMLTFPGIWRMWWSIYLVGFVFLLIFVGIGRLTFLKCPRCQNENFRHTFR